MAKKKTWELIAQKYYWLTLWQNIEAYIKGYNICLTSKAVSCNLILVIIVELNYIFYILSYSYILSRACAQEEK